MSLYINRQIANLVNRLLSDGTTSNIVFKFSDTETSVYIMRNIDEILSHMNLNRKEKVEVHHGFHETYFTVPDRYSVDEIMKHNPLTNPRLVPMNVVEFFNDLSEEEPLCL